MLMVALTLVISLVCPLSVNWTSSGSDGVGGSSMVVMMMMAEVLGVAVSTAVATAMPQMATTIMASINGFF